MSTNPQDRQQLLDALDALRPPMPPGYEDWTYRDVPLMSADLWAQFLRNVGEGNYKLLAMTIRQLDDGEFRRGQFWISPAGMASISAWGKREGVAND